MSLRERFEAKYMPVPWSGCWLWTGSTATNYGYGRIGSGGWHGPNLLAHRVSYKLYKGHIPNGLSVLHSCDEPSCVNPNHLFLGTQKENNDDMDSKGRRRSQKGERCGASKLTDEQVLRIRADSRSLAAIASDYGISPSQAGNIKRRKHWGHL